MCFSSSFFFTWQKWRNLEYCSMSFSFKEISLPSVLINIIFSVLFSSYHLRLPPSAIIYLGTCVIVFSCYSHVSSILNNVDHYNMVWKWIRCNPKQQQYKWLQENFSHCCKTNGKIQKIIIIFSRMRWMRKKSLTLKWNLVGLWL